MKMDGRQGSEWIIGVAMQMAKGSAGVRWQRPAPAGILPAGLKAGIKIHRRAIRQGAGGWPARCQPERAGCPRSPGTQLCNPCRNFRDRFRIGRFKHKCIPSPQGRILRVSDFGFRIFHLIRAFRRRRLPGPALPSRRLWPGALFLRRLCRARRRPGCGWICGGPSFDRGRCP